MTLKEIDQIIEDGQSLKLLAQAYGELASEKIKKIRLEVERNRLFFDEISRMFAQVKAEALKKHINLTKSKKVISLLITSNLRFNGNINNQLISFFKQQVSGLSTDVLLIGKAAIDHFKSENPHFPYQTITLKKDMPSYAELLSMVDIVGDYSQIFICYSELKSILVQSPNFKDINLTTTPQKQQEKVDERSFIFEPEILKILQFFDSQIKTLLIEQTFLESELSRTASRLIAMDQAQIEANRFINKQEILRSYIKRSILNTRILESIASSRKELYKTA